MLKNGITSLLFCCLCFTGMTQATDTIRKAFVEPAYQQFFIKYPEVRSLSLVSNQMVLTVDTYDPPLVDYLNEYDLENPGDLFYFNERFGKQWLPPQSWFNIELPRNAYAEKIQCNINKDSIHLTYIVQHFDTTSDEKVFYRVESPSGYLKGLHLLSDSLRMATRGLIVPDIDSVIIIRALLRSNGNLEPYDRLNGDTTHPYVKAVLRFLKASKGWTPYEAGGRKVHRYLQLYIQKRRNGSYLIRSN